MIESQSIQLHLSAGILFVVTCLARSGAGDESDALHQWHFQPSQVADGKVTATRGGLQGKIIGSVSFSEDAPTSLQLDGKTNRVQLTDDLSSAKLPPRAMSAEAWVAVDRPQEWGGIVGAIQDNGTYERGWLLGFRKSQFFLGLSSTTRKRLTYMTADDGFAPGSWYHVVGTYDGTTMKLYLDGQLVKSSKEQSGDILYPPKGVYEIGAYHDDNELYPMQGKIAEVSVYGRALSAAEVRERFESRKAEFPGIEATTEVVQGWPTYMHDNARSGVTDESLKLPLELVWTYHARRPPAPAWPPPAKQDFWHNKHGLNARVTYDRAFHVVSDGRRVFFGSSADDKVYCLDLQTGKEIWSIFTEGPVRLAPTLHEDRVYFGSDDGAVYCVAAVDGKLVWKFRAVKPDRRVPGNGRIISVWPIRSGVIIENGKARFAAGLFPTQGTYQFALDAKTGKELAKSDISFSPQGYLQRRGSSLTIAQGRAPEALLSKLERTGKTINRSAGQIPKEFPFAFIGANGLRFAGGDGKVAAFSTENGEKKWSAVVHGRAYSLAVAGGCLLVSSDAGHISCFRGHDKPAIKNQPRSSNERVTEETGGLPHLNYVDSILRHSDVRTGYCLVLGSDSRGLLPLCLAYRTKTMRIVVAERDEKTARELQRLLDGAQLELSNRMKVHHIGSDKLPYGSALFNLIVANDSPAAGEMPATEVRRVLRPGGGVALISTRFAARENDPATIKSLEDWAKQIDPAERQSIKGQSFWVKITRRPLEGAGEWTHIYGDPANTACSGDRRVGGSFSLQWFGRPGPQQMIDRHHRTVPPLYTSGRLFVPGDNRVIAVDAYNGTILWNEPVDDSRRVGAMRDAGSMTATENILYVAAERQCIGLDSQTGEQKLAFDVPSGPAGQARHWGYVARVGERLFGSATKPGASRSGHSRRQINETYYDNVAIVTSDGLFSMQRHKGDLQWRYDCKSGAIINPTITIADGCIYFVESQNTETLAEKSGRSKLSALVGKGANLVAIESTTGKVVWQKGFDFSEIQHHLYLCFAKGKLVAVGTKNKRTESRTHVWYDLHGFDAADGKHLWSASQNQGQGAGGSHGEQDHHPVIVGDVVYQEPYAYDLHTGRRKDGWKFARGGHGCGTISASASSIFFRAGNPTMCDLVTRKNSKVTTVSRTGCWINVIPAGGLLLIPEASSGCTCNFAIQSSMALMPVETGR